MDTKDCGQLLVDTMNKSPEGVFTVTVKNMVCPECGADHARLLDVVSTSIEAFAKREACLAELN